MVMAMDVIGLIPAAGKGTRLGELGCSKEILPIGDYQLPGQSQPRPKVLTHYLLEHFARAGINQACIVIGEGKEDIIDCLGDGQDLGVSLQYRSILDSPATPVSLDSAFADIAGKICALGFPDILFRADNAYGLLLEHLQQARADVVLGLFPAMQPEHVDMVERDSSGRVNRIVIKPDKPVDLAYTWSIAVWSPAFTEFMHEWLASCGSLSELLKQCQKHELYVGDVIQAAIEKGMRVDSLVVSELPSLDAGTPENLARARAEYGAIKTHNG
jgi:glucose-1-phosphate thymidylyltransferase